MTGSASNNEPDCHKKTVSFVEVLSTHETALSFLLTKKNYNLASNIFVRSGFPLETNDFIHNLTVFK
jgi:hypothetical protein